MLRCWLDAAVVTQHEVQRQATIDQEGVCDADCCACIIAVFRQRATANGLRQDSCKPTESLTREAVRKADLEKLERRLACLATSSAFRKMQSMCSNTICYSRHANTQRKRQQTETAWMKARCVKSLRALAKMLFCWCLSGFTLSGDRISPGCRLRARTGDACGSGVTCVVGNWAFVVHFSSLVLVADHEEPPSLKCPASAACSTIKA